MSMFYELMMRKKEETLYPVIKGSLTESPSGVFSGFSTSNYITMPITPSELSNCSIKLRFTTANVNTEQDIIWLKRNNENIASYFGLQTHLNGNHCYMYSYVLGASSYVATSFELLSNTTYDCVINIENGKLSWKIGEPNNLIEQNQLNFDVSNIASFYNPICFGSLLNTGYAFNGSIDFNNSYIILNGTKYNLQAVVGYTIVGSPTIVDGVVSGFSSSNYLSLPDVDFSSNFESQVAFKINTYSPCGIFCLNSYDYKGWHCIGSNILAFSLHITNGSDTKFARLQFTVSENTDYIANAKRIGNNVVCSLYSSGSLVSQQSLTIDEGYNVIEGVGYNIGRNAVGAFDGTIDLNNTYIKVNNKLYFNGQPS